MIVVRPAQSKDADAIRAIYNHAVARTTATMDVYPRSPEAQQAWMEAHDGDPYPALVAETAEDGQVVGYASLSPYIARPGYRGTTENSVYVHCDWQGLGIGGALLTAIVGEAARRGFRTLLALISADNARSLHLHTRAGFVEAGTLRRVGRKFDQDVDVVFLQLMLDTETASNHADGE